MPGWIAAAVGGSAIIGAYSANKAAQTQADAMRDSAQLQKQMFDVQNAQQAPYRQTGYEALNQIGKLGSGTYGIYDENGKVIGDGTGTGYLTKQFGPEDFQAGIDPSYNFRLQQGNLATSNLLNSSGGLVGGNALQGLTNYGQNAASQEYGNAFNRFQTGRSNIYNTLASMAGLGQTSLGQTGQLSGQAAGNIGGAITGAGSAIGAGQIGVGNALAGGFQNYANQQYLSTLLGKPPNTGGTIPGSYSNEKPISISE